MLSKHIFLTQKLRLIGSTFFGFAQNSLHDFHNMVYELLVALSSTNATKTKTNLPSDWMVGNWKGDCPVKIEVVLYYVKFMLYMYFA